MFFSWLKQLWPERRSAPTPLRMSDIITLGGTATDAGQYVDHDTALQLSTVSCCVRVIAETIGSLSLHVYRRTNDGRERAVEHPVYRLLHDAPNDQMTSAVFREVLQTSLLLNGNAYCWVEKTGTTPVALWPLQPQLTRAVRNNGTLIYQTHVGGEVVTLDAGSVLHVPGLSFDGIRGLDPIRYAARSLGIAMATDKFAGKFFSNNTQLGMYLTHPGQLSPKAQDNLRNSISATHQGVDRAFLLGIFEEGMVPGFVQVNAEQAQFLESRRYTAREIASRIFRVPPFFIGEDGPASSVEQQSLQFVRDVIRPTCVKWEQEIDRKLFREDEKGTLYAEFAIDSFARADQKTRYEAYAIGRQNGWLNINEIKEKENEPGIGPQGDIYLTPLNMVSVDQLKDAPDSPPEAPKNPNTLRRNLRPVLEDAAARVLRKEINALDRAMKKYLIDQHDAAGFQAWATDFYADHERIVRQSFEPVASTLEMSDEALNKMIADHCAASLRDLALALWHDDPHQAVVEVAARWEAERPKQIATTISETNAA